MSRTITAMFNDRSEAEAAAAQLRQFGTEPKIIDKTSTGSSSSGQESSGGFWSDLKEMFVGNDDRSTYEEGVRRGQYLLCANVPEDKADRACSVIESAGAVDIEENERKWRSEGWAGSSGSGATGSDSRTSERGNVVDEERIPVIEEQLRVGKREEQRGGARVRSYVEERPVSEQVNLREEHVDVERRQVDKPVSTDALGKNDLLQEREVEMRETAERPVVGKEARVKEEVVLQKTATEHSEQVGGTVRSTEVEVDQDGRGSGDRAAFGFDKDGKPSQADRSMDRDRTGR
jgi:stress response protein YsnF